MSPKQRETLKSFGLDTQTINDLSEMTQHSPHSVRRPRDQEEAHNRRFHQRQNRRELSRERDYWN